MEIEELLSWRRILLTILVARNVVQTTKSYNLALDKSFGCTLTAASQEQFLILAAGHVGGAQNRSERAVGGTELEPVCLARAGACAGGDLPVGGFRVGLAIGRGSGSRSRARRGAAVFQSGGGSDGRFLGSRGRDRWVSGGGDFGGSELCTGVALCNRDGLSVWGMVGFAAWYDRHYGRLSLPQVGVGELGPEVLRTVWDVASVRLLLADHLREAR